MSFERQRCQMVEKQLKGRGIRDGRLLKAFAEVPRERFIPKEIQPYAYEDRPLPIGEEQTISQPYIVALMVSLLGLRGGERILEVGTGSGYQTAILARLAETVYSIERIESLAKQAKERIEKLGYRNIRIRCGNGALGWREHAPYSSVILSAAVPRLPKPLEEQVAEGGCLVAPVGSRKQQTLVRGVRSRMGFDVRAFGDCAFVPLLGEHAWPETEGK